MSGTRSWGNDDDCHIHHIQVEVQMNMENRTPESYERINRKIALPMHPSNAFTIEELNANLEDILHACEQDVQKLIGYYTP